MPSHPFRFAELLPQPIVEPWVARIWEFTVQDGAPPVHHVPPDGCTSLLVTCLPGAPPHAVLSGPWLAPLAVPVAPGARYVGLRFRCGAAGRVLGVDPATLVNRIVPAESVVGAAVTSLSAQVAVSPTLSGAAPLFTRFLVILRESTPLPDPVVHLAVTAIEAASGAITMAEVATMVEMSPTSLRRRFREEAGISAKQFARIIRLRATAMDMMRRSGTLSRIAAERGYADQSHLTLDAVSLFGLTPAVLRDIIWQTEHDLADG